MILEERLPSQLVHQIDTAIQYWIFLIGLISSCIIYQYYRKLAMSKEVMEDAAPNMEKYLHNVSLT